MKKECENCGNFSVFYTKIGCNYFKTTCGRCWANKNISGNQNICEKWEEKTVNVIKQKKDILDALDNAVAQIGAIKEELIKE